MKIVKSLLVSVFVLMSFSAMAEDGVARAVFTSAIDNREPTDQVGQLTNDNSLIYFFTELRGMQGHVVTHRWEKDGEVKAEVTFNVNGNRWRVWSSKNLQPAWLGNWQVSVLDEGGNMLAQESFAYIPAEDASTSEPPVAPAGESPAEPPSAPAGLTVE